MTETLLVTLQNRASRDSCVIVNSLEKKGRALEVDKPGNADRVPVASSILVRRALHQQDPGICTKPGNMWLLWGRQGPRCGDKALSISTLRA